MTLLATIDLLTERGDVLSERFHRRLSDAAPHVRRAHGMEGGVLSCLGRLRSALDELDSLTAGLGELRARHLGYGALVEEQRVVGAVLHETIREVAGPDLPGDDTGDWDDALRLMAALLLSGARG